MFVKIAEIQNVRNMKDLTGQKFGIISVTSFSHKEERNGSLFYYWNCIDDEGYENIIEGRTIKSGSAKTCRKRRDRSKLWKGYGEISASNFLNIKNSAKKRGIEFNVSIKQIWDKFLEQNRKCALSGQTIYFPTTSRKRDGTASLDRINSNMGYVPSNIQWVHKQINISKNKLSDTEFIILCGIVTNNINNLKDVIHLVNNNSTPYYIPEDKIYNNPTLRNMYDQLLIND